MMRLPKKKTIPSDHLKRCASKPSLRRKSRRARRKWLLQRSLHRLVQSKPHLQQLQQLHQFQQSLQVQKSSLLLGRSLNHRQQQHLSQISCKPTMHLHRLLLNQYWLSFHLLNLRLHHDQLQFHRRALCLTREIAGMHETVDHATTTETTTNPTSDHQILSQTISMNPIRISSQRADSTPHQQTDST